MQGISVNRRPTVSYGLFAVTVWLLLKATLGVSQTSAPLINLLDSKNGAQVILACQGGYPNEYSAQCGNQMDHRWRGSGRDKKLV
jgi:hypothetical protein